MTAKKYLIVNADDFGYSYGINQGIIEAHLNGIVTSTSVMVDEIAASQAAELSKYSNLSVGLHFVVLENKPVDMELDRQVDKFISIVGRRPDHVDVHKSSLLSTDISQALMTYSSSYRAPIRKLSGVSYIQSYIGTRNGNDLSTSSLKRSIDEAVQGYNELMCHVGYVDDYLRNRSSYSEPRELELTAICDPTIRQYLIDKNIELINWRQVA